MRRRVRQWLDEFARPVLGVSDDYYQRLTVNNADFYQEYRDRLSVIIERLESVLAKLK